MKPGLAEIPKSDLSGNQDVGCHYAVIRAVLPIGRAFWVNAVWSVRFKRTRDVISFNALEMVFATNS